MKNIKGLLCVIGISILCSLAACGNKDTKSSADTAATTAAAGSISPEVMAQGEAVFKKTCIACHQATGLGVPGAFPPLAKSDFLTNREASIGQVITGKTGPLVVNGVTYNSVMPPQNLSDEDIAAVLTYVYNSFGNSGNPVTVEEVKAVRAKINS